MAVVTLPNLTDSHQHLYHLRWSRTGRLQQALRGEGGHVAWMDVPHEEGAPDDARLRENRVYTLLARLTELAAEGRGMDAAEVRLMHEMLPLPVPADPWWHDAARAERVRENNAKSRARYRIDQ